MEYLEFRDAIEPANVFKDVIEVKNKRIREIRRRFKDALEKAHKESVYATSISMPWDTAFDEILTDIVSMGWVIEEDGEGKKKLTSPVITGTKQRLKRNIRVISTLPPLSPKRRH